MTRRGRAGQPEPRRSTSPRQVGLLGVTDRSARRRLPADLDRRPLQHDGRSDGLHHPRQPALRAVRQLHDRSRRAPLEVRRATTSTCSSGPSSPTTRAARSPTPGSSRGNAFADFLLGYPTSATSGHRPRRRGRPHATGCTSTPRTTGRRATTSRFNLGLRYEYNQHMYDVNNRLSSIDLSVPGGRFVIASDENGASTRAQRRCCR